MAFLVIHNFVDGSPTPMTLAPDPDHDAGTNTNGTGERGTGWVKETSTMAGIRDVDASQVHGIFFSSFFFTLLTFIYDSDYLCVWPPSPPPTVATTIPTPHRSPCRHKDHHLSRTSTTTAAPLYKGVLLYWYSNGCFENHLNASKYVHHPPGTSNHHQNGCSSSRGSRRDMSRAP